MAVRIAHLKIYIQVNCLLISDNSLSGKLNFTLQELTSKLLTTLSTTLLYRTLLPHLSLFSLSSHSNTSKTFALSYFTSEHNTTAKMVQFTVFKGSKEGKIVQSTTTKELGPNEVLIKVTHSGLCGTDEHYKHADMVLGHEGAGVVEVSSTISFFPNFN